MKKQNSKEYEEYDISTGAGLTIKSSDGSDNSDLAVFDTTDELVIDPNYIDDTYGTYNNSYVSKEEYDKLKDKVKELEKRIDKLTICSEVEKL
jgi:hypothetical protein